MGERLAYLPRRRLALVAADLLARSRRWQTILVRGGGSLRRSGQCPQP